ncbi:hypothetical protein OKW41_006233 [Paraburkholderia sp. UCT70]
MYLTHIRSQHYLATYKTDNTPFTSWKLHATNRRFPLTTAIFRISSHRRTVGYETTHRLPPRLFPAPDGHSMSSRFKLRRCLFDTINIKLEPGLWSRNVVGRGVLAKTRLRRLRKWPQGKTFCALQSFRMKVATTLLLEGDAEVLAVELAACPTSRTIGPKPAMNRIPVFPIRSMASPQQIIERPLTRCMAIPLRCHAGAAKSLKGVSDVPYQTEGQAAQTRSHPHRFEATTTAGGPSR